MEDWLGIKHNYHFLNEVSHSITILKNPSNHNTFGMI